MVRRIYYLRGAQAYFTRILRLIHFRKLTSSRSKFPILSELFAQDQISKTREDRLNFFQTIFISSVQCGTLLQVEEYISGTR